MSIATLLPDSVTQKFVCDKLRPESPITYQSRVQMVKVTWNKVFQEEEIQTEYSKTLFYAIIMGILTHSMSAIFDILSH